MKLTMTLQAIDPTNNESVNRSMGNITTKFIGYTGDGTNASEALLPTTGSADEYDSFMAWVDAVARGLNSLSSNTYRDAAVIATWGTTEELNG